jgi:hypothetical protein
MRTKEWHAALACAALALLPARLAAPPALARAVEPPAFEATALALVTPDLLSPALGLPLGPRLEDTAPAPVASAPPAAEDPLAAPAAFVAATAVPEPAWLALLSLASAAAASRGRRRCPPRHPHR